MRRISGGVCFFVLARKLLSKGFLILLAWLPFVLREADGAFHSFLAEAGFVFRIGRARFIILESAKQVLGIAFCYRPSPFGRLACARHPLPSPRICGEREERREAARRVRGHFQKSPFVFGVAVFVLAIAFQRRGIVSSPPKLKTRAARDAGGLAGLHGLMCKAEKHIRSCYSPQSPEIPASRAQCLRLALCNPRWSYIC